MATGGVYNNWSNEYIDAKCSPCAEKNKDQVTDHYCYDCQKHMCKACLVIHNKLNVNHIVIEENGDNKDELTEKCGKHKEELITLCCLWHNKLMCIQCRKHDHRKCTQVKHIKDVASQLSADPDLQVAPEQLQSALDNIKKAIEALDNDVASINKKTDSFLNDLEEYTKKLLSKIEELREEGKRAVKMKQDQLVSEAIRYRQDCVLAKDEIICCLEGIKRRKLNKTNLFIIRKKSQIITQRVNALYNDSERFIKELHFNFMTDKKIINTRDSLNCLVSTLERPEKKSYLYQERKNTFAEITQLRRIKVYKKDEERWCILGCCRLIDGCLLIADAHNNRLKRVDPSSDKVTKYCATVERPRNVCCIGPQEIAVAFGSSHVHVYNAVSLTRTRIVELSHKTSSIDCHDGLLYCSGRGDTVYVYDLSSGRKLRDIRPRDTDGWDLFFCDIENIALNGNGDRLYVIDRRGLICVKTDGQLIFCLSLGVLGLSEASGLTTDHRDHVYVCGLNIELYKSVGEECEWEPNDEVEVDGEGQWAIHILNGVDPIGFRLRCLSYDAGRRHLYVGGECGGLLTAKLNI